MDVDSNLESRIELYYKLIQIFLLRINSTKLFRFLQK
jgi:hypothetical protein